MLNVRLVTHVPFAVDEKIPPSAIIEFLKHILSTEMANQDSNPYSLPPEFIKWNLTFIYIITWSFCIEDY